MDVAHSSPGNNSCTRRAQRRGQTRAKSVSCKAVGEYARRGAAARASRLLAVCSHQCTIGGRWSDQERLLHGGKRAAAIVSPKQELPDGWKVQSAKKELN